MKLAIDIDSTALGTASCLRNFYLTVIGSITDGKIDGGYKTLPGASMVYGIAVHKFVDVMYKTGGHFPTARAEAERSFNVPKLPIGPRSGHLGDPKHLIITCYNLWTNYIEEDNNFEVLQVPVECYWCKGSGKETKSFTPKNAMPDLPDSETEVPCSRCKGQKIVQGPATEMTFRIPYYEDDFMLINLCGTIDRIGKFKGGCFCIPDWKTTSAYDKDDYLSQYELSRQLRVYTLACKMMAKMHPDSILGRIGATRMGACIDAIFIKSKANENEYKRSDVYQFSDDDLKAFDWSLHDFCHKLSRYIQVNNISKEGILNGTCDGKWGKCRFWNVCKNNDTVAAVLLARDFKRKIYDPLKFND